ncbi:hypothetical protein [Winogradskyella sp. A3E31]|uniref:hypothetical protein n=1 Tax=Winogradskyella sp. A3E31 TaxID=3349637 RepID=UPI00398B0B6C
MATLVIELFAAIVGIVCFKKYKDTPIRYFIYFLIYIFICELLATYTYSVRYNGVLGFLDTTRFRHNYWWGTLYWEIGGVLFYIWFFAKIIVKDYLSKALNILAILFLICSVAIIIFNFDQYFTSNFKFIDISGTILIVISITCYFLDVMLSERVLYFYQSIYFYIAALLFLWWIILTPLTFYQMYFTLADPEYIQLKSSIYLITNCLTYIGFGLILILCKPPKHES